MRKFSFRQFGVPLTIVLLLSVLLTMSLRADGPRISDAVRRPKVSAGQSPAQAADSKPHQPAAGEAADPQLPSAGEVELKTSRVYVFVGKTGLGHEHAVLGNLKSGDLHLGREKSAGKLEFDMRSFVADTADARRYVGLKGETDRGTAQKVTSNMLGPDVLNVASFPIATFEIVSAKKQRDLKDGAAEYLLEGDLTLRGVARRIRFTALDEPKKGWHHLRGRFAIRQTDFGIKPFSTGLGAIGVADELTIYGDLWVRPEQPLADKSEEPAR